MMDDPKIGISWQLCEKEDRLFRNRFQNYADAVRNAGGDPISIQYDDDPKNLAESLDGWLITGGKDIDPTHFGQPIMNNGEDFVDARRFTIEKELFQSVKPDMPILAICYGCQFLNIMQGGDLIQHLEGDALNRHRSGSSDSEHDVSVLENSKLHAATQALMFAAKSHHHQVIGDLGEGLEVVARDPESDVIEAIEIATRPFVVGVQYHPERSRDLHPAHNELFKSFVGAAATYRARRLVGVN